MARRKRGIVAIPINKTLASSTLAANTLLGGDLFTSDLTEDFFCISADLNIGWTGTAGEGPIEVGLAHGDYSDTEIEENLELSFTNPDSKIEQERSRRLVRRIGYLSGTAAEGVLNEGRTTRVKLRFSIGGAAGQLKMWMYNRHTTNLTGTTISYQGYLYGRWLR